MSRSANLLASSDGTKLDTAVPSLLVAEARIQLSTFTISSTRYVVFDRLAKQIQDLTLPLPPLAEQKAIAAVLGALDDKIELNRRMNATLEAMARALFQSWFVDFDPVRAKLDGRPPAGLDPATAAFFPASFQDSALGPHPARMGRSGGSMTRSYCNGVLICQPQLNAQ